MVFENYTNLPQASETSIEEEMGQMSITEPNISHKGTERRIKSSKAAKRASRSVLDVLA
jgi:hypothetical protein